MVAAQAAQRVAVAVMPAVAAVAQVLLDQAVQLIKEVFQVQHHTEMQAQAGKLT
jgi:hypothetical protein